MNKVLEIATGTPPRPGKPFRGIDAFQYGDRGVFPLREMEAQRLLRQITVYRGVILYGESGVGKSSLINAGLLPQAVLEGFLPERVRVQPRREQEIVIERIPVNPDSSVPCLPSLFSARVDTAERIVLSVDSFEAVLRKNTAGAEGHRSLLIFDQFEELITLFEEVRRGAERYAARDQQKEIVDMLVRVLRDEELAVKLLFGFREDFLGRITALFNMQPELMDHYLRLQEPSEHAVAKIVRSPFERFPGRYEREISIDLAENIEMAVKERSQYGMVSLSEIQIVCLRLWEAEDSATMFQERGLEGVIIDYLHESLSVFDENRQAAAIALLGFMVTSSGARNVISEEDLLNRAEAEAGIDRDVTREILETLESKTRFVRREQRRGLYFFEITSEFLAPWIMVQRDLRTAASRLTREILEAATAQEKREEAAGRRWRRSGWALILVLWLVLGLASFGVIARLGTVSGIIVGGGITVIAMAVLHETQKRAKVHADAAKKARRMRSTKQLREYIGTFLGEIDEREMPLWYPQVLMGQTSESKGGLDTRSGLVEAEAQDDRTP